MKIFSNIKNFFQDLLSSSEEHDVFPSEHYLIDLDTSLKEEIWTIYFKGTEIRSYYGSKKDAIKYCWTHHKWVAQKQKEDFHFFRNREVFDVSVI